MKVLWRRWRPRGGERYTSRSQSFGAGDIFDTVDRRITALDLPRRRRGNTTTEYVATLNDQIRDAQRRARQLAKNNETDQSTLAIAWLWALVLQTPRAAEAQAQMNKVSHGYHNRKARLYELIDFNDAFVDSVLAMPEELLPIFEQETKRLMDKICKRVGSRCFSDGGYQAISHGLSREIAGYEGAREDGYEVEMANRSTDALGIDMRITDPVSLCTLNIDTKTRSSYRYRISNLKREGRLSEEEMLMAERNGFARVYNGQIPVVIWRIDSAAIGGIVNFTLQDNDVLVGQLRNIFSRYGVCERVPPKTS